MEVIVSHSNTDFDGLAAMVAAKKLYPDAELAFPGKLCRNVQEFMALHKDTLNIYMVKDIPLQQVRKLILVDTRSRTRIAAMQRLVDKPEVEIHIYDHHPANPEDIKGNLEVYEALGATTTMLVELIRARKIALNSFEATILALGIYEDTGCLTFSTTTARDAEAVAYLLAQGANLAVIANFIERPLTEDQKSLFNTLILSAQHYLINGVKVLVTKATIDEYVGGLALLTHKLGEIESLDVILAVVQMEDRVHIVARSRIDSVNVAEILEEFGGAGHEKAASATIKDGDVDNIVIELHRVLREKIKPRETAATLMSSPVKIVGPSTTIDEARKIMLRYGHSGLPVVDGLQIVGVISRRDLDKAKQHGLGHAPVKGYMTRQVVTVIPETPLREVQHLLIENNIGRLPVIEKGRLVGIVSRTDVLRTLHGKDYPEKYQTVYLSDEEGVKTRKTIKELMVERLPESIRDLLGKISYVAGKQDFRVYLVGGFVRDLLLDLENFDIDLVVEGDGVAYARVLAEFMCGRVRVHEKFGTAVVILHDGFKIDVVTARTEYYEYPAALPKVETSSLKKDLYRRDFTINAMAIALGKENFGDLIDYFGGRRDLERKQVRILYNLSFVEDPTRIFRAIRFEQRYGFLMETQTLELAKRAIKDNWLGKLSYDRIREELRHIFKENFPLNAINRMNELGLWKFILPEITVDEEIRKMVDKLPGINDFVRRKMHYQDIFHPWLVYFITMIHEVDYQQAMGICERLRMTKEETRIVHFSLNNWQDILGELAAKGDLKMSQLARLLRPLPLEAYAFILTKVDDYDIRCKLEEYLDIRERRRLSISGDDLKAWGYKPGPLFREVLDYVEAAKLDALVHTPDEEAALAKKYLQDKTSPNVAGKNTKTLTADC
ncbi:MAG: CBS domain-containing protein [Clostridia bacterium]|nr:CBS domain-containing protein [Clostridia bacterium]